MIMHKGIGIKRGMGMKRDRNRKKDRNGIKRGWGLTGSKGDGICHPYPSMALNFPSLSPLVYPFYPYPV
jgi:hypothetical protein